MKGRWADPKFGKIIAQTHGTEKTKTAHTIFEVLERRKNFVLISVKTKTGRTHQIRVHFHSIGHSVAGDKLYKQKQTKGKISPPRLFLHAEKLSFTDLSGERQKFQLPLAQRFTRFLGQLEVMACNNTSAAKNKGISLLRSL